MNSLLFFVVFTTLSSITAVAQKPDSHYPVPKNAGAKATLGVGIQRTMTLLATSTPEHRNTVKILFYGQSITEQDWWKEVAADLKRRFPFANLVVENRALGGFSSQLLVKTAETDLYSFYPDLMIFHVYGSHNDYEDIIRRTRGRTTAEVLIQTDHVTNDADLTEETDPSKLRPDGKIWNSFMNYLWLPTVAKKYGTALLDQRNLWKQYLKDNNLHASQLLRDGVHQNEFGNFLMAELTKPYLVKRSDTQIDPYNCDSVKTWIVGKDTRWRNGKLTVPFEGNRVDAVMANGSMVPLTLLIDGKTPSTYPELYCFTRALSMPGGKWPVILKMSSNAQPLVEDWTMEVTKDKSDAKQFSFSLSGSFTGLDGEGRSDKLFTSNSGRVVIDPKDWNVEYSLALPGINRVPDHFVVRWSVVPHFADTLKPQNQNDPSVENVMTLAQGLPNGRHILEISGKGKNVIKAIRVYKPPIFNSK